MLIVRHLEFYVVILRYFQKPRYLLPLQDPEQAVERVGMFLYSRMIADLGASSLSVHNICMGICDIYYSFSQGMGKASLIQAGNDYGATRGKYLRNIQRISRGESIWTSSAACIFLICLRNVILKLYHLEGTELVLGVDIMILVALVSFPEAQAMTHAGILRGIGRTGYIILNNVRNLNNDFI